MSLPVGWIVAGVAAAGGVAYVIIRRRQAAAAGGEGRRCGQVQDAAAVAAQSGNPYAVAGGAIASYGCQVGSMLDDLLGNPFEGTDEYNKKLNGAPRRRADAALMGLTQWETLVPAVSTGSSFVPASYPGDSEIGLGVLEYENGCVPYPGAPGWEKCDPNTRPQCKPLDLRDDIQGYAREDVISTKCARIGQGGAGDPTTRRHLSKEEIDEELKALAASGARLQYHAWHTSKHWLPFPLPVGPTQEGWWVKGKPVVVPKCPPGTARSPREVDNRTGATGLPTCSSTDITAPPPRTSTTTTTRPGGTRDHRQDPTR